MFNQLDKDGSGNLDVAEMNELAQWAFSKLHQDGEAPADWQQKEAERLMKRLDADGDGQISFDEFAAWYSHTSLHIRKYRQGTEAGHHAGVVGHLADTLWSAMSHTKPKKGLSEWINIDDLDYSIHKDLSEDDFKAACRKDPERTARWFEKLELPLEERGCLASLR